MKNTGRRKLFAWTMSALLIISLLPGSVSAGDISQTDPVTLIADPGHCALMGVYDEDCNVYYYIGDIPNCVDQVRFTKYEDEDVAFIVPLESNVDEYPEGTNIAPVTGDYRISEDSFSSKGEKWKPEEAYQDFKCTNCFAYCVVYGEDYDMDYYVIPMPAYNFTAKAGERPSEVKKNTDSQYRYTDYMGTSYLKDLYEVSVPIGADRIELSFNQKCLAYNYLAEQWDPAVAGDWLYGWAEDSAKGMKNYWTDLDYNKDLFMDYIQIQDLYASDYSGGGLLYAVTFRYDLFNAFVDKQALSGIVKTEDAYTPMEWRDAGNNNWILQEGTPVPLYTVTVPEGTETVELGFPEPSLAYNYTADGKKWLAGEYENNGRDGVKKVSVEIDANGDGEADRIQIQTPYDDNGSSTILYAITFDGMTLDRPEGPEAVEGDADTILHNIAAGYAGSGAAGDPSAPWIAADMMAYEKAFPKSKNKLSSEQKQAMTDEAIAALDQEGLTAGDAAKYVIALVSMGIDPSRLTTSTGKALDGRGKLDGVVFTGDGKVSESAANPYTLPYVILAYRQFRDTSEAVDKLKETAVKTKDAWMDTTWGTDGMTPMILALAPLRNADEAAGAALDEAVAAVKAVQTKSGSLGPYVNASTDGLAATGFAALGIDPAGVTYKGFPEAASLMAGLVGLADPAMDGFGNHNSWNTEQGFRGLIAASQSAGNKVYDIYDFSGLDLEPGAASKGNVDFHVIPEEASVTVKDPEGQVIEPAEGSLYDLPEGTYKYTVSADGYKEKSGSVTVTAADAARFHRQTVNVSLAKNSSPGSDTVNVTVRVLSHGTHCGGTVTYKNRPDQYSSLLKVESYTTKLVKNEGTARDALVEALDDSGISYVEQSNGYFSSIGEFEEFGHGSKSGWLYMVNGSAGTSAMQNVTFSRNGTLTVFFTDDYSKDYGSENWGGSGDKDKKDKPGDDPGDKGYYDDTVGHWAEEAIDAVTDRGWMNGVAERKFAPDMTLSRAMFVTMLYRLEKEDSNPEKKDRGEDLGNGVDPELVSDSTTPSPNSGLQTSVFTDVEKGSWYEEAVVWAVANDIVKGTSETTFSPNANVTREQMAAFLSRYTESKDSPSQSAAQTALPNEESQGGLDRYLDKDQISDWALESMSWAVGQGLINGVTENQLQPKGTATRAQAATILIRFDERILQSN